MKEKDQEFWTTQPVGNKEEGKTCVIKAVEKSEVRQKPLQTPPYLVFRTLDVNREEEGAELYKLLFECYVGADSGPTRFAYSVAQLRWWHNAKPNNIQVALRVSKGAELSGADADLVGRFADGDLVGFISAVPQEISVNGATMTAQQVVFFTLHPAFRGRGLGPLLIQEVTRRSYRQGICTAVFTAAFTAAQETPAIPRVLTSTYFHYLLSPVKLAAIHFTETDGSARNMIAKHQIKVRHAIKGLIRPFQPKKDTTKALALFNEFCQKRFTVFPLFTEAVFKKIMTPVRNILESFVLEVEDEILAFASFFIIENKVVDQSLGVPAYQNAYAFYVCYSDAMEKHLSKDEYLQLLLLKLQEVGADVATVLDIGAFHDTEQLKRIGFLVGSGSVGYHFFNINWGREIQHKDLCIIMI